MSWLLLEGRQEGGGRRGTESRTGEKEEEEYDPEVTFRRRFSPERRAPTIVGLTGPALLKGRTFYSP